jgi:putative SOS response-associated peptidase YedK
MKLAVSVFGASTFRLIHQPCFWPDAPRPSSRTPLKTKYESREAIPATWGLVNSWAKDASRASICINAKAETVDRLPSFREAFEKRRCVVPADGFYEWCGPKARREPLWIPHAIGRVTFLTITLHRDVKNNWQR